MIFLDSTCFPWTKCAQTVPGVQNKVIECLGVGKEGSPFTEVLSAASTIIQREMNMNYNSKHCDRKKIR
jgi:hypothetical protein